MIRFRSVGYNEQINAKKYGYMHYYFGAHANYNETASIKINENIEAVGQEVLAN